MRRALRKRSRRKRRNWATSSSRTSSPNKGWLHCSIKKPEETGWGRDAHLKIQQAVQNQLAAHVELLNRESEKVSSSVTANSRLVQSLASQRFLLTVILSYVAGLFTVLIFDELISLIGPMLH